MKLIPYDMRVLVKPDEEKDTTESGIFVGNLVTAYKGCRFGTVLAVGPNDTIKAGDRLMWKRPAGLPVGSEECLLLNREDVLAKILPEGEQ